MRFFSFTIKNFLILFLQLLYPLHSLTLGHFCWSHMRTSHRPHKNSTDCNEWCYKFLQSTESRDKMEVPDAASSDKTMVALIRFYILDTARHSVEPVTKHPENIDSILLRITLSAGLHKTHQYNRSVKKTVTTSSCYTLVL